jgi:hypothetical protein
MATSVLSEWAFSQGGITISKHRNRLKGDIVEALQCVKCSLHSDLLFREPGPSSLAEDEPDESDMEAAETGSVVDADEEVDEEGWDCMFLDEDDDDLESNVVMDDFFFS